MSRRPAKRRFAALSGSRLYGVELDSITGRIAQKLYPKAQITVAGFETTDRRDFYDLAIGNVPFGNYPVADMGPKSYARFRIHNYFFGRALDLVRPDGAFYLWPAVPGDDVGFARALHQQQNLTILPGSYLARDSAAGNPGRGRVRISLVASVEECVEAAQRIRRFLTTP